MLEDPPVQELPKRSRVSAEAVIAVSALMVSVVSLAVGVYQGYLNSQMVAAASWPYLTFETGNADGTGKIDQLAFTISNGGVGPARIETFQLFFDDKPVGDFPALLLTCCALDLRKLFETGNRTEITARYGIPFTNTPTGSVIPAATDRTFITWVKPADEANAKEWHVLDRSRFSRITAAACYCSVLDECWFTDFRSPRPRPVSSCPAVKGPQFGG
jgi:hypothetical protein